MAEIARIAVIPGDGIGAEVVAAALVAADAACAAVGGVALHRDMIDAGAGHFSRTGDDIAPGGEARAAAADAILTGPIGLPGVRHTDGTAVAPHLRLREQLDFGAGMLSLRAYRGVPPCHGDPRAGAVDLVILHDAIGGLFWSAVPHGRSDGDGLTEVRDTLRVTRTGTERLCRLGFALAERRRAEGRPARVTCVSEADLLRSMAFFRAVFDGVAAEHPGVAAGHAEGAAQARDLVRRPWEAGILVTEGLCGGLLAGIAAGLVGGAGMAAAAEIGEDAGLFRPAHGAAPALVGCDAANPLGAILAAGLMLRFLGEHGGGGRFARAGRAIERAVEAGFDDAALRPAACGGDMGTGDLTRAVVERIR